jgi:hypothetical protein
MSYLFYISYAREDNIDGLVSKFYEDLGKDIAGKMAARPDEVGFFDAGEIEPWATEFPNRASAVRQSNVFIAIYSPYYFQRKFCGMEWTVFSSRVEAYAKSLPGGFALPALMIPVLWQNEREVSPHIPTALTGLQYKYHALGKTYAEQGLRVMLRNKRFRKEYRNFIPVLADLVIEAARRHKLPDLPNLPAFKEIMPTFPVDETLPSPVIEKVESGLSDTQTYDLSPTTQFVPLHDAYERIVNFARRFGEPHVALAMHAAVPLGLTPELVHLIRVNFVNRAPMIAEADLLLSPLCREVGGGLYEMYPEVRELLLVELNEDEEIPDNRIEELAEFLMVYATRNLRSARFPELRNFLVAQQWTALARLRPAETAQSLASALGKRLSAQNPAGSLRLAQLARSMSAQLAGQDNVLVYAAGVESLAFGDVKMASETFGILGSMSQSPAVKSITLPAPADLAQLWPESAEGLWAEGLWAETQTGPPPLPAHVRLREKISEGGAPTTQVAWSPDGGLIIGASTEGALRLWDVKTARLLNSFGGIPREVNDIAWSPDGRLIATASFDNEVSLWIPESGKLMTRLAGHRQGVKSVAWSPDGNALATASADGAVKLWDFRNGRTLNTLEHGSEVNSVAWAPAGAYYLVAGYGNGEVIAWDTNSGKMRRTYRGHKAAVNSVAISPNRAVFASGSDDGAIRIWRIDEPEDNFQIMLEGHTKPVTKICFSPKGNMLASRSNDDTARIWSSSGWRCAAIINVSTSFAGTNVYFPALAFHPSEPLLATCVDRPDEISILELDEEALINAAFHM